ncbi:MAG TPA: transcriptional regulator [Sphingomonadaceae bacterium]
MTADIDSVLHPPARLQIAAVLARVSDAEFATLKDVTGVADSVLSKHLSALGEAGYVKLRKAARDGRQRTWASLTGKGRKAFAAHMAALHELAAAAGAAAIAAE